MEWQHQFDVGIKQRVQGKFSLGRYFNNNEYYPTKRAKYSKTKTFGPDLAFCVLRLILVNIVVCVTRNRQSQLLYIYS